MSDHVTRLAVHAGQSSIRLRLVGTGTGREGTAPGITLDRPLPPLGQNQRRPGAGNVRVLARRGEQRQRRRGADRVPARPAQARRSGAVSSQMGRAESGGAWLA